MAGSFADKQYKRTYHAWYSMKWRCAKIDGYYYERYGKKGITVCKRWETFRNFVKDMGYAPDGMTLDRIDNTKGYKPSNCRWATWETQANNRDVSVLYTVDGVSLSQYQWARKLGITRGRVRHWAQQGNDCLVERIRSLQV